MEADLVTMKEDVKSVKNDIKEVRKDILEIKETINTATTSWKVTSKILVFIGVGIGALASFAIKLGMMFIR